MNDKKLQRINELARKSKSAGLTEAEKAEQAALRDEYREGFRRSMTAALDSCVIVDEDGNREAVRDRVKRDEE